MKIKDIDFGLIGLALVGIAAALGGPVLLIAIMGAR